MALDADMDEAAEALSEVTACCGWNYSEQCGECQAKRKKVNKMWKRLNEINNEWPEVFNTANAEDQQ